MDRLSRRAIAAQRAHMSYGQYIAALKDGRIVEAPDVEKPAVAVKHRYGEGVCKICERPFIKNSGTQLYCKDCKPEATRASSREYKRRMRRQAGEGKADGKEDKALAKSDHLW